MATKTILASAALAGILSLVFASGLLQAQSDPKAPARGPACSTKEGDKTRDASCDRTGAAAASKCPTCSCKPAAKAEGEPKAGQSAQARLASDTAGSAVKGCPHLAQKLGAEGAAAVIKAVRMGLVVPTPGSEKCPGLAGKDGCSAAGCSVKAAAGCGSSAKPPAGTAAAAPAARAASLQPVLPAARSAADNVDNKETVTCACGKPSEPVGFAVVRAGKTHFFCNEACRDAFLKNASSCGQKCGSAMECDKAGKVCGEKKSAGCCPSAKESAASKN